MPHSPLKRSVFLFFLLPATACPTVTAADRQAEGPLKPFLGAPRLETQQVFKGGRFPNVVVATDGAVLATWGQNTFRVRRSEDGGKSWEPEIIVGEGIHGGGVLVDENSGDVLVFVHPAHPPRDGTGAPRTMYRSTDHGQTWKAGNAVFHKDVNGKVPSLHMCEHGVTLRRGPHAGRLIRPARVFSSPRGYNTAVYSDDGGKNWHPSRPFPEEGTGEGAVAELSDGRLYYNSRVHWPQAEKPTRRRGAWSRDGGETWTDRRIVEVLPDGRQDRAYGCMGGLVRLPVGGRDILLFSNLDTSRSRRERVTVWASFDGGQHWPLKRLVHDGPGRYSSLAAGRPGTPSDGWIYLQFEEGRGGGARMARFNLAWVLEGKPTGDGALPQWLSHFSPSKADVITDLKKRVLRSKPGRHFGRAAAEALPDGTWLLVYREADHHARNRDGRLHMTVSRDRGRTWSREDHHLDGRRIEGFPAWPPGAGPGRPTGPGEPWLYRAADGTLILHCWKVKYSDSSLNGGTWQITSSDGGRTWSEWSQVDFQGVARDDDVFATDDHFVIDGTIYAGARQFADGKWKNVLIRSKDNGRTWRKVSDITSYRHNTSEVGLEYLGGKRILAVLNTKDRRAVYRTCSEDMGRTWRTPEPIQSQTRIWDRCRIWTRSHLQGRSQWWSDPVILGVGDQALVPGQSMPRRNALWLSGDGGGTWTGPIGLDDRTQDAGYGDMLYDEASSAFCFYSYHGTMDEAALLEYRFVLRDEQHRRSPRKDSP